MGLGFPSGTPQQQLLPLLPLSRTVTRCKSFEIPHSFDRKIERENEKLNKIEKMNKVPFYEKSQFQIIIF